MATYKTAEVAAMIGVHPNTVRLYEKWLRYLLRVSSTQQSY